MPFLTFSLSDDPAYNYRVAKSWSDEISTQVRDWAEQSQTAVSASVSNQRQKKSRIIIGYLSADFKNHATAHLMLSLFGIHDRSGFKIIAFSYGNNDHSGYRKKIERDCDEFIDLYSLNDTAAARAINNAEVDILVEMKGYTDGNRLAICAHRPAPIQVAWLGFPGTTGADFLDYIITDPIVTPMAHARHFSEKFVYMPHTYQVNDCHQKIAAANFSRQEFGLPQAGFIFCSFNEPYKIEPEMFEVWMNVLNKVPGSILWLLKKDRATEQNLKNEAGLRGVAAQRLIFADKLSKDRHLARLQLADLYLDTRIVNGHTTTSDALWAGVPVLTLQGKHFASRVSASLLTAVGLPELITSRLSDYEELTVHLATDPDKLMRIQEKLAQNRLTEPLFDTAKFTENLEKAYKMMWQIYLSGEAPRQIEVLGDVERV
jgi:protein O-GlcNAc transferase